MKMPLVAELSAITLAAVMAMNAMAETVNTVTVTKFNQPYPYTGKATASHLGPQSPQCPQKGTIL